MKLSVVIPAYNEERYIGTCVRSVLREACRAGLDLEVVVVNNASTDRTRQIVKALRGVRLVDEPTKGLARARHRGYLESSGELIANIDADCKVPRGYFDRAIRAFERDPRLALLSGPFFYHDLPPGSQITSIVFYLFQIFPNVLGQRVLKLGAVAQGGNYIVRRSALDRIGGYNTSLVFHGEDTDIAIRLSRVGLVRFSFRMVMTTSGRRLRKEGTFRAGVTYTLNIIFMIFYRKVLTRTHEDVRDG